MVSVGLRLSLSTLTNVARCHKGTVNPLLREGCAEECAEVSITLREQQNAAIRDLGSKIRAFLVSHKDCQREDVSASLFKNLSSGDGSAQRLIIGDTFFNLRHELRRAPLHYLPDARLKLV
jgi:hypothetical protein